MLCFWMSKNLIGSIFFFFFTEQVVKIGILFLISSFFTNFVL